MRNVSIGVINIEEDRLLLASNAAGACRKEPTRPGPPIYILSLLLITLAILTGLAAAACSLLIADSVIIAVFGVVCFHVPASSDRQFSQFSLQLYLPSKLPFSVNKSHRSRSPIFLVIIPVERTVGCSLPVTLQQSRSPLAHLYASRTRCHQA